MQGILALWGIFESNKSAEEIDTTLSLGYLFFYMKDMHVSVYCP